MTLSREHGFPFWLGWATLFRGGALAAQGQGEAGIRQIHQGFETVRATGAKGAWTAALALLARAYEQEGQAEAGLSVLAEALEVVHKTGERVNEAELYRLKGELTLQQFKIQGSTFNVSSRVGIAHQEGSIAEAGTAGGAHPTEEAEMYFLKAIDIARQQQAKSWELRAVMSLSCLWQSQGKKKAAHDLLAEIYDWFTEGFDTKDLQEAKVLLAELA
jgi:predicted ATPase